MSSLFCPDTCLYGTVSCDTQGVGKAVEIHWNHSGGVSAVEGWALQCLISAWFITPNSFSVHFHGRAVLPLHNTCCQHKVMEMALCISYGIINIYIHLTFMSCQHSWKHIVNVEQQTLQIKYPLQSYCQLKITEEPKSFASEFYFFLPVSLLLSMKREDLQLLYLI